MKKGDKKMMLILFVFIGLVLFVLLLYYFVFNGTKNDYVNVNINNNGMDFGVKDTNINQRLFSRKDFIRLKSNIIFRKNIDNILDFNVGTSTTGDNIASNKNNGMVNNIEEYNATKRNPFKPFRP